MPSESHRQPAGLAAVPGSGPPAPFREQVRDALRHLHDRTRLQTHPLAALVDPGPATRGAGRGKKLQDALLEAVEVLRPGRPTPADSPAARSHRLLTLRYLEGQEAGEVQRRLAVSRSEYYLEHQRALDAVASLLRERWRPTGETEPAPAGGPDEPPVPPAPADAARRDNLPAPLTSFVGRAAELAAVAGLLGSARLVTLVGVGGCGKTRLALAAAERVRGYYPDGTWLADLAPLSDPALLPKAVALALGVHEQPEQPLETTLAAYLRPRRLLLLLDNCEHLIAACARLAEELLRACPALAVLGTSREPLGVPGEVTWRVPSLGLPDPARLAGGADERVAVLLESEAVQLFVQRAAAAAPGFAPRAANAAAVAEVCRRLDGIPLALELAAARVGAFTVDEIAARLDDRFRLLTGGRRTALRRQQTLQAMVDWSHDLLTGAERALLRRLSVFAGGFTLAAAEAVCGADPVGPDGAVDALGGLVDKSLVLAEETADGTRYRLLETIRQYAAQKLVDADEAAALRDRHRDWHAAWAEAAEPHTVARDQRAWLARLEAEHDNLRAAIEWSAAAGDGAAELRLAAALGHFWQLRGYAAEGRARLRAALERGPTEPSVARARALDWLGVLESHDGRPEAARALADESVALARAVGDRRALVFALKHLGTWLAELGEGAAAAATLREQLAAARAIGEEREAGVALTGLAILTWKAGDRAEAERMVAEADEVLRRVGEPEALSLVVWATGCFALRRGRIDEARALLGEALALVDEMDFPLAATYGRLALGDLARAEGAAAAAGRRYGEALRIARERVGASGIVDALRATAGLRAWLGQAKSAARLFGAAQGLRPGRRPSWFLEPHDGDLAAARAALGEAAFAAAWAEGQAMTPEEAMAFALDDANT